MAIGLITSMPEQIAESEDTIANGGIPLGDLDDKFLPQVGVEGSTEPACYALSVETVSLPFVFRGAESRQ